MFLVVIAFLEPLPAAANISDCLGAYRAFSKHQKSVSEVADSCLASARRGAKISLSLLGTAYYQSNDRAGAEPWLLRAAYLGDITSAFLLADIHRGRGEARLAALWANRGQQRIEELRKKTKTRSSAYLDSVQRNVRRLVKEGVASLIDDGRRMAAVSFRRDNPFVGKWRIGPNANCQSYYTEIAATGAEAYFAGRKSSYDTVRFDLPGKRMTLTDSAGEMTMRLVDGDTMEVIRVMEHITRKVSHLGVIATRCE